VQFDRVLRWDIAHRTVDWQNPVRRPLKFKVRIPDEMKPFFQADFEENEVSIGYYNTRLDLIFTCDINPPLTQIIVPPKEFVVIPFSFTPHKAGEYSEAAHLETSEGNFPVMISFSYSATLLLVIIFQQFSPIILNQCSFFLVLLRWNWCRSNLTHFKRYSELWQSR
jgi:hypothetical protein